MMNEINENMMELNEEALEQVSGGATIPVTCAVDKANVRSGPGLDYSIIGHLYKGEKVAFKGEKRKDKEGKWWICINKADKYGWIRTDLVKR